MIDYKMFKTPHNKFVYLILLLICAASSLAQTAQPAKQSNAWQNPVFDFDFPDPTVIRAADGYFYAYATQAVVNGKLNHIQLARSSDLVNWQRMPDALPQKPG